MPKKKFSLDAFTKHVLIVFIGTSLLNFFSLLYQLLIAHKLIPAEFAAFNSLLSLFVIIATPLVTVQLAIAKYCAEFKAQGSNEKVRFLLFDLSRKSLFLAVVTLAVCLPFSRYLLSALKVNSDASGIILVLLFASTWATQLFTGAVQGLEYFWAYALSSAAGGFIKFIFAYLFISLGYAISGALGAYLLANIAGLAIMFFSLKHLFFPSPLKVDLGYKKMFLYLFPLALSYLCFALLVNSDMVLVRFYFSPTDSGAYALAQMIGKIMQFLPIAVSVVLFPKTSGQNARKEDTTATVRKSLVLASILCLTAVIGYNLVPDFTLRLLTGKSSPEIITLGRLFSVSMSFFALVFILISYFLSMQDYRFLKVLTVSSVLQCMAISLFHKSLFSVQYILCINAMLLFGAMYSLSHSLKVTPTSGCHALS